MKRLSQVIFDEHGRITRDGMLMTIANIVELRSTCPKRTGCVISKDGRIIATGYNGAPSGLPHCLDDGCIEENGGCIRTVHAEAGAIAFAARQGLCINGATLYVTRSPCLPCARLVINAGIKRVVFRDEYRDRRGIELLEHVHIEVCHLPTFLTSVGLGGKYGLE